MNPTKKVLNEHLNEFQSQKHLKWFPNTSNPITIKVNRHEYFVFLFVVPCSNINLVTKLLSVFEKRNHLYAFDAKFIALGENPKRRSPEIFGDVH